MAGSLHDRAVFPRRYGALHLDFVLRQRSGSCRSRRGFVWSGIDLRMLTTLTDAYSWSTVCVPLQRHEDLCFILFALLNAVWATLYLESWKRRSSELAHMWGTLDCSNEMLSVPRPLFKVSRCGEEVSAFFSRAKFESLLNQNKTKLNEIKSYETGWDDIKAKNKEV